MHEGGGLGEEWCRSRKEEDRGITTVLSLYGDRKAADQIIKYIKKLLVYSLEKK